MGKMAIDVILLPPEDIMDKAIKINRACKDDSIRLNKKDCLPHISLCMGVARHADLSKIKKIIDVIGQETPALKVCIVRINRKNGCFDITKTRSLQVLHEGIMRKLSPFLSYDAKITMLASPPVVSKKSLYWINHFRTHASFKRFYPHLTLAVKSIPEKIGRVDFTVVRLAVCHLGNFCTCHTVLHECRFSRTRFFTNGKVY